MVGRAAAREVNPTTRHDRRGRLRVTGSGGSSGVDGGAAQPAKQRRGQEMHELEAEVHLVRTAAALARHHELPMTAVRLDAVADRLATLVEQNAA